jgi:hypothetical protein
MIDQARLDHWKPLARSDNWHMLFVGSEIREMLAEIERLRRLLKEARQYVSDAGNDEDSETRQHSEALLAEIDR